jgi:signal peptide peptidase SppA
MKLADIVYGPWMLEPRMLDEIQGIYEAHTRRDKLDMKAVEMSLGGPLEGEQKPYQVENGTAIIPVQGVISKRMNMFTRICGGASSEMVRRDFLQALDDPYVERVLLYIDSPGGSVDGMFELANTIYQARGDKPITAFTDGQMCSAAMVIASAADKRYISSEGTITGSLGVVRKIRDTSAAEASAGVSTTVLTAGKYKGVGHEMPLSQEHRDIMQSELDYMYTTAVNMVARNLGQSPEQVVNEMAEGRVFIGSQAVKVGLVDGVSTLDDLVAGVAPSIDSTSYQAFHQDHSTIETAAAGALQAKGATTMDLATMKAQHPEVYQAILEEGSAAGALSERERITAILSVPAAGHQDLVAAAIADGKSGAGDMALAIMTKEKGVRAGKLAEMVADTIKPAAAAESAEVTEESLQANALLSSMVDYAKTAGRA